MTDAQACVAEAAVSTMPIQAGPSISSDIQGLVRFGYRHPPRRLPCCCGSRIRRRARLARAGADNERE